MKCSYKYITFCFLLASLTSCDFESNAIFLDEVSKDYALYDYYVDAYGNEGIVAEKYVSRWPGSNRKWLVVISLDETYTSWGPLDELVYNVDSLNLHAMNDQPYGLAMLQTMLSRGIEKYPAQAWCYKKNKGEQFAYAGSWRLPSRYEFRILSHSIEQLNTHIIKYGGTPIATTKFYWTCTEDYQDYVTFKDEDNVTYDPLTRAVIITPVNSTSYNKDKWRKNKTHYARAIKYIYYQWE